MFGILFFTLWCSLLLGSIGLTIFWIIELIDVARREFPDPNAKLIWLLIVLLAHGIGALVYYFVGKDQGYLPGEGSPPRPPHG
ncbi:MAG: PLD nuclease N-terminal domain-containing protein [Armatimonadota bacterium]|nr:PLD nuclease N-terminal domain-containing protein [Armatimonadota bacterium]